MNLDKFFVSILFVILPGLVAAKIFWGLTGNRDRKDWHEFLEVFLFSLVSYSVYGLAISFNKQQQQSYGLELFNLLLNQNVTSIYLAEILWVAIIAVPVAFLAAYFRTHKILNRFGQYIKATYRYGDEDVWEFFHNTGKV